MCNSIIDVTTSVSANYPALANSELQSITEEIFDLGFNMRVVAKKIAAKVAYVRDNAEELCGEFEGATAGKRFEKWGTEILGLKRAQLNAFAKVGKELLFSDGSVNLLPEWDKVKEAADSEVKKDKLIELHDEAQNFTMTQLQTLVPLGKAKIEELVYDGKVKSSMTVADIRDVVKENDPKKDAKEAAKKKREQAKKEKEEKKKADQQRIHGKEIAQIKINQLDNGSYVVTLNGDDITKTNVGKYLIKNICK